MKHTTNSMRSGCRFAAALWLSTALLAGADTLVTFQVDMSNSGIDTNTQTVSVRGTLNNWGNSPGIPFHLTNNPAAANPYLYTGTTNVPLNGLGMAYKYTLDTGTSAQWESTSVNRVVALPAASGSSLTAPLVYFSDIPVTFITVLVTFPVNMAQQINIGAFDPLSPDAVVQARGPFDGWGGSAIAATNDPSILTTNQFGLVSSNVYVSTYDITGSPGQTIRYKYYTDPGSRWESPTPEVGDPTDGDHNRFFNLADAATQMLPITYFNDAPYAPKATNLVTFQVDMTAQVLKGAFDLATGQVQVRGDFTSWGTSPLDCTNNPAGPNPNLYTLVTQIVDGVGAGHQYKFFASVSENGGWESIANNRTFSIVSGTTLTLPVVYFNDLKPGDLLPEDTVVTFTVNMTNAVGTDAHAFDPLADKVYLNGTPNGWLFWDATLPELTNNPVGSKLYSIELVIPKGTSVQQTYKYSINGSDNEAGTDSNHVRFVRKTGTYTMPLDKFSNQYVEPSFGKLAASARVGDYVPVSWLGRPGIHLQASPSLTSPVWTDLLSTDGSSWNSGAMSADGFVSVTNYPTSGAAMFFRLVKP